MNPATIKLLSDLGLQCDGLDPAALDHHLYVLPDNTRSLRISVPSAGCSARDIARLIYGAGAAAARKEIATAHQAFLASIKL